MAKRRKKKGANNQLYYYFLVGSPVRALLDWVVTSLPCSLKPQTIGCTNYHPDLGRALPKPVELKAAVPLTLRQLLLVQQYFYNSPVQFVNFMKSKHFAD